MADGMTWRENLQNEKEKIKAMDGKQRWNYFKSYYLIKTVVLIGIILMIVSIVHDYIRAGREVLIAGCVLNATVSEEGCSYLTDAYFKSRGGDDKKQVVNLSTENFIDFSGETPEMEGGSKQLALFTQISAGDIDYLILDEASLTHLGQMGVLSDLNQLLPKELSERLEDKFVFEKNEETGKEYAAGIELSAFKNLSGYDIQPEKAYLVFTCAYEAQDKAEQFLEYLLSE